MESETQAKAPKGEKPEGTAADADKGDESEADKEIKRLNAETEGLNQAIAEKKNAEARAQIAGVTAGKAEEEKPKEIDPVQYNKDVFAGKFNK